MTHTPPEIAKRLRVSPETVIGWIRAGELLAINVASRTATRPRFRIKAEDLEAFELRRSAVPTPTTRRRRRPTPGVIQFF